MSEPRAVCLLGRIPPNGKGERHHGEEGFQWRPNLYLPSEHRAACKP